MTFEELRQRVSELEAPTDDTQRIVDWCADQQRLGLARSSSGGYELFIGGERMIPVLNGVRRHLRFDEWRQGNGNSFRANRLVLPGDSHFQAVAAFLAEELLRSGIVENPAAAFAQTEPLIELALRGQSIGEETLLGLFGELWLLVKMLGEAVGPAPKAACLNAWKGYHDAARDFEFREGLSLEVKTTRGIRSMHAVSNLTQIDPHRTPEGMPTEQLWLLSLGVSPVEEHDPSGMSLAGLVERTLQLLHEGGPLEERNGLQNLFLKWVAEYGHGPVYKHDEMRGLPWAKEKMRVRFGRIYNGNDERMLVLRRSKVAEHECVMEETVRYSVDLPERIADGNPRTDIEEFAREVVAGY